VNQTNDAWFFKSSAAEQHFVMNVFRAIENRRPVIVSGNTGISGVIDERGHILKKTELFKEDYFKVSISPGFVKTFYTAYGDVFVYVCIIFILGIAIILSRRKKTV